MSMLSLILTNRELTLITLLFECVCVCVSSCLCFFVKVVALNGLLVMLSILTQHATLIIYAGRQIPLSKLTKCATSQILVFFRLTVFSDSS